VIYLDHNATTPILAEVADGMMPYLREEWGNPSSSYGFGAKLKRRLEIARASVAELVGARYASEIIFTSGATEANNSAIHSAILGNPEKRHIVTSQVEHSSVLTYLEYLERYHGYAVTRLPVNSEGLLSVDSVASAITGETALVSLMWANNETGVLFPVEEIATVCRNAGVPFHCDAVQCAGKIPINTQSVAFDYFSISGHKFGASKGIGALFVRNGSAYVPLIYGGHQEGEMRGGTENVPAIVGLGVAANIAWKNLEKSHQSSGDTRDWFEKQLLTDIPCAEINGGSSPRLPNTSNIHLPGCDGDALVTFLDQKGFCISSGSACMESAITPSHVILAMSGSHERASESIRISIGVETTAEELRQLIDALKGFVAMNA